MVGQLITSACVLIVLFTLAGALSPILIGTSLNCASLMSSAVYVYVCGVDRFKNIVRVCYLNANYMRSSQRKVKEPIAFQVFKLFLRDTYVLYHTYIYMEQFPENSPL